MNEDENKADAYIAAWGGSVAITEYKGALIIATQEGIFRYRGGDLERIPFAKTD